jgi:hypothetical protein
MKLGNLVDEFLPEEDSPSAQLAHKMGLTYMGWGKWGKNGETTHQTIDGKLTPITSTMSPISNISNATPKRRRYKQSSEDEERMYNDIRIDHLPTKKNPSFDEIREALSPYEDTIMASKPVKFYRPKAPVQARGFKPKGLWYSKKDSWVNWVEVNMPEWKGDYLYTPEIDKSNFLIIDTPEKLQKFARMYRISDYEMQWSKVAEKYDGIEFPVYFPEYRLKSGFGWYSTIDVESGCVWNPKSVKDIKQIPVK